MHCSQYSVRLIELFPISLMTHSELFKRTQTLAHVLMPKSVFSLVVDVYRHLGINTCKDIFYRRSEPKSDYLNWRQDKCFVIIMNIGQKHKCAFLQMINIQNLETIEDIL